MEEEEKIVVPNFIIIENSVFLDSRLSSTDIKIYGLIVALSNNDKRCCYCSNSYFSKIMNLKKRQIQNILNKLRNYCYISITFENNKRLIRTFIDKQIYKRDKKINVFDYDWLNDEE